MNIMKYNPGKNSAKATFDINADFNSLIEKIDTYHSNLEESSTIKVTKHEACSYSLLKIRAITIEMRLHDKVWCKHKKEKVGRKRNYIFDREPRKEIWQKKMYSHTQKMKLMACSMKMEITVEFEIIVITVENIEMLRTISVTKI